MGSIMKQPGVEGADSNEKLKNYMIIMDSMTDEGFLLFSMNEYEIEKKKKKSTHFPINNF